MKRYHDERPMMELRAITMLSLHGVERPAGTFRKRKGIDCGKACCQVCHGHKFPRRQPTKQEILADQDCLGFGFDSALLLEEPVGQEWSSYQEQ